jgi:hypothetical protein
MQNTNDIFNYTDNYIYRDGRQTGKDIQQTAVILLNGRDRMTVQDSAYYNCIQPMQYFKYPPATGINVYSFGINPTDTQPSGACNMSKIDNVQITMRLSPIVTYNNKAIFKCYGLATNVFCIVSGLGGLKFTN